MLVKNNVTKLIIIPNQKVNLNAVNKISIGRKRDRATI